VLADWRTAPVAPGLRAMLELLEKLTLTPDDVVAADAREALDAGVSEQAYEDAVAVAALFNTIDRLADAFAFHVPDHAGFRAGARMLLKRGYIL
jgi:alkylhydroperoxidase family enzyme